MVVHVFKCKMHNMTCNVFQQLLSLLLLLLLLLLLMLIIQIFKITIILNNKTDFYVEATRLGNNQFSLWTFLSKYIHVHCNTWKTHTETNHYIKVQYKTKTNEVTIALFLYSIIIICYFQFHSICHGYKVAHKRVPQRLHQCWYRHTGWVQSWRT